MTDSAVGTRRPAGVAAPRSRIGWCIGRRPSGVRTCLLMLVVVCLLPASLLAGLTLYWTYSDGRRALVGEATLEARAISHTVDAALSTAIDGLQSLGTSPALAAGDFAAFQAEAQRALPYQPGSNVVLSGVDGQQLVNTLSPPGQPLPPHNNRSFQQQVIRTGRPAVSDVFLGGLLRRPLIAVEVPVHQDARVAYTLAMGFLPERFAAIIAQQSVAPDRVVSIFDSRGVIVARTHEAARFVGHPGAPDLLKAMRNSPEGMVETRTLEGIPVVAAYTRSRLTGWSVAVGVPRELLLARLERLTLWLAGSGLVLLLLSVLAAQAIARRIVGAFDALIAPAIALGEGRSVDSAQLPVVEARAVAEALAQASRLLRARTHERDLAAQATAHERLRAQHFAHAAHHDPLTGLLNRARFIELLQERIAASPPHGGHAAVLFLDLDNFKPINDLHGHAVGDELLQAFAARLQASVRGDDVVARLGGDEFAMLVCDQGVDALKATAHSLMERLTLPYAIRALVLKVSASVGVACYPEHGRTAEALLEAADAAMYRAKQAGKSRYAISGFAPL
jgi:diguanylate cyclase (GGDEF)-like protein